MNTILSNKFARAISWILTIVMVTLSVPLEALAFPQGIEQARRGHRAQLAKEKRAKSQEHRLSDVRELTSKEMGMIVGRGPYRNAYLSGTMPWHRTFHDVNMCTGNLMKSFTDVQVAPARGAGLVLQRTYNSNDESLGPFGRGWMHAYDIRMEEASSPDLISEEIGVANQSQGGDPTSKMDKSVRTDFFGGKHVYKRDADGLYTPPPYMHDWTKSDYKSVLEIGPGDVDSDTEIGLDGTEKHFIADGNERICDSIKDRYGNETILEYTQYTVKPGVTKKLLTKVTDPSPSGRELNFTWTALSPSDPNDYNYRITDVTGPLQAVHYAYYMSPSEQGAGGEAYNLKSVTLNYGGSEQRTTTYTYTTFSGETGLLASISDPLGHTVSYTYDFSDTQQSPPMLCVSSITEPAGDSGVAIWGIEMYGPYPPDGYGTTVECMVYVANPDTIPENTPHMNVFSDSRLRVHFLGVNGPYYANMLNFSYQMYYDNNNNLIETFNNLLAGHYDDDYYTNSDQRRGDFYEYGRHGNVLRHWVDGFEGKEDVYKYWGEEKYFQKKWVKDMAGNVTTFDYGSRYLDGADKGKRGNLLYVWDAKHEPVYVNNGDPNDPDSIIDPDDPANAVRFEYGYNDYGQKISETNLNGVITEYSYEDIWGNLTEVIQDPGASPHLNRTTAMVYDEAGRVTQRTDPMGRTSQVAYNDFGQPDTVTFPAPYAETITYSYGDNGRLDSVATTADNRTTTLSYETGSDRVSGVTDSITGTIEYTYTRRGSIKSKTLPNGSIWTYTYGTIPAWGYPAPGDLGSSNGDPNAYQDKLVEIRYHEDENDIDGRPVWCNHTYRFDDYQGADMVYNEKYNEYDELTSYCVARYCVDGNPNYTANGPTHGWLKKLVNEYHYSYLDQYGWRQWDVKLISSNTYEYDDNGNRISNTITVRGTDDQLTTRTEEYQYDELNRLTYTNYSDGATQTYTFDDMGNRLTLNTTTYGYNAANMLTILDGQTYATYDANGNQLTGGGRTNVWDTQNRLRECMYNSVTSTFTYGSDGLRRSMTVGNDPTIHFALDGTNVAQEGHLDQGAFVPDVTCLTGPRGVEYRMDESTGTMRYYVYDGLGSVLAEVGDEDANHNPVKCTRKYDVYGSIRGSTGTGGKQKFCGSLGHTQEDSTNGLIYMRARWYDPVTGRFVSEDPKRNGSNWYTYCEDNPVNFVDPNGRESLGSVLTGAFISGMLSGSVNGLVGYVSSNGDLGAAEKQFAGGFAGGFASKFGLGGAVGGAFGGQFLTNWLNGESFTACAKRATVSGGISLVGGGLGLLMDAHALDLAMTLNLIQMDADLLVDAGTAFQKL